MAVYPNFLPKAYDRVKFTIGDKGYVLNVVSSIPSKVSAKKISLSLDGRLMGTFPSTSAMEKDEYAQRNLVPTADITAMFTLMQQGAKILTVDAGESSQVSLSESNQAINNLQSCWNKLNEPGFVEASSTATAGQLSLIPVPDKDGSYIWPKVGAWGARTVTFNAGNPLQIPLIKSSQSFINFNTCIEQGRKLGGVFKLD